MARPTKLSEAEIQSRLGALSGWTVEQGKLFREFKFADFKQAFAFMTKAAAVADELDHHPEWFNVYNKVRVHLSTHDAGGLTELDFKLASAMNAAAG